MHHWYNFSEQLFSKKLILFNTKNIAIYTNMSKFSILV